LIEELRTELLFIDSLKEQGLTWACRQQVNAHLDLARLTQSAPFASPYNHEPNAAGQGTFAYVLDSWGGSLPHASNEFIADLENRFLKLPESDFTGTGQHDTTGHGMTVSALIGGAKYGVAKETTIIPIKVLSGPKQLGKPAFTISALNFVLKHAKNNNVVHRSVVNLSLSTMIDSEMNETIDKLNASGLLCVTASGNDRYDTSWVSPASAEMALAVGAVDRDDCEANYSNAGKHVAVLALGDADACQIKGTHFKLPRLVLY